MPTDVPTDVPTDRPVHDFTCTDDSEIVLFTPEFGASTPTGAASQPSTAEAPAPPAYGPEADRLDARDPACRGAGWVA